MQQLDTTRVARLTGPDSDNATDVRWNVHGTDLGHPLAHRGRLHLVFGDTWGADGVEGRDWRSNVMARVADPDPAKGLVFADMVTDDRGWAKELLGSRKITHWEKTVIPTNGVSTGERMVLHYMSVRRWGRPGRWRLNHAGLAHSDDDGRTWTKHRRARWPGRSNFGQVAFVPADAMPDGDAAHVHVFGIPGGRLGAAHLARVPRDEVLAVDRYEYWDGTWWQPDRAAAAEVVPAPVGELSVRWSSHHERWIMLYLHARRHEVVARTATDLTGPWELAAVVATATDYPMLYAPYLLPETSASLDLYFTMSRFDDYNVDLMRTCLQ